MDTSGTEGVHRAVAEVRDEYPNLKDDNAFVAWFAEAYLVASREVAVDGLVGAAKDMGVDGVYIDNQLGRVELVQGKYHKVSAVQGKALGDFAEVGLRFADPSSQAEWEDANPKAQALLLAGHHAVHKKKYALALYFATTGKVSAATLATATKRAKAGGYFFEVVDEDRVPYVLQDWLEGAAPPLPQLAVRVIGPQPLKHSHGGHGSVAWVFTTTGHELKDLHEKAGDRLFARNVRGYLGVDSSRVNAAIRKTAAADPSRFWYVNNGVTIVADGAQSVDKATGRFLLMENPQVVNGQQTIRTLAACKGTLQQVHVLVRVIVLPKGEHAALGFKGLTREIVQGANRQNPITQADLMANDPEQVRIARGLRKRHYLYLRKRMASKEATKMAGRGLTRIDRDYLANAVAATTKDRFRLVGQNDRWEEPHYKRLFPADRPLADYLVRWWLGVCIESFAGWEADGSLKRPARWATMAVLWHDTDLGHFLGTIGGREAFVRTCERTTSSLPASLKPLYSASRLVLQLAKKLYSDWAKQKAAAQKAAGQKARAPSADVFFRSAESVELLVQRLANDGERRKKVLGFVGKFISATQAET